MAASTPPALCGGVNVVIPMAGIGVRFQRDGYAEPKPLIHVLGKPMLWWVVEHLALSAARGDTLLLAYPEAFDTDWHLQDRLRAAFPRLRVRVALLRAPTEGAADTAARALAELPPAERARPTLLLDCDTFYRVDVVDRFMRVARGGNCVFVFRHEDGEPIFSYTAVAPVVAAGATTDVRDKALSYTQVAAPDAAAAEALSVTRVAEKERISPWANSGAYGFADGAELLCHARDFLAARRASPDLARREAYVAVMINWLLSARAASFVAVPLGAADFVCLGTPLQVRQFCALPPSPSQAAGGGSGTPPFRWCFDLDGTLVSPPAVPGDYTTVRPYEGAIAFLRAQKARGHTIIIHTARGMLSQGGGLGAINARVMPVLLDTLARLQIPYDELVVGKPYADAYFDDKAVSAHADWERATGFYSGSVGTRAWHTLDAASVETIVKRSTTPLHGEIHWYAHAPAAVRPLLPAFIRADPHGLWLQVERVYGTTLSRLLVGGALDAATLRRLMAALDDVVHHSEDASLAVTLDGQLDIYANYAAKMDTRGAAIDFSALPPECAHAYAAVRSALARYAEEGRGCAAVIHGDPVLSNVITASGDGGLKLLDMRGELGGVPTIYGDANYDWAKLLQSLSGYEHVQLGRPVPPRAALDALRGVFWEELAARGFDAGARRDVQLICVSLLMTLIPLHAADKAPAYWQLALAAHADYCAAEEEA